MRKIAVLSWIAAGCFAQTGATVAPPPPAIAPPPDVAAHPASAEETAPGVFTVILERPASAVPDHPGWNDCAVIKFTAWKRDGSLFSTSGIRNQTVTQCLSTAMPGLAEAIQAMSPGEKRRVWFTTASVPAKTAAAGDMDDAPPGIPLTVDVSLTAIRKAPLQPADLRRPSAGALHLPSGVAMQILRPGSGAPQVSPAARLTVHYSSWTEAGRLVETTVISGHPATVTLGTAPLGWRDALGRMSPGEKVRLWIPAAIASPDNSMRTNLVCDLELLRAD